jgi:hypothetical protein
MLRDMLLLYVSQEHDARAARFASEVERHAGYVVRSSATLEALGAYITCAPHAVILDMSFPTARDVCMHLRSIAASPLFVLVDDMDDAPRADGLYALPRTLDVCLLATGISAVLNGEGHLVLRRLIKTA